MYCRVPAPSSFKADSRLLILIHTDKASPSATHAWTVSGDLYGAVIITSSSIRFPDRDHGTSIGSLIGAQSPQRPMEWLNRVKSWVEGHSRIAQAQQYWGYTGSQLDPTLLGGISLNLQRKSKMVFL